MERLAGLCVASTVIGCLLLYDGISRLTSAGDPQAAPRPVSLSDLLREAPARPVYVSISGYRFSGEFVEVKCERDIFGDAYLPVFDDEGGCAVFKTASIGAMFLSSDGTPVTGLARVGSIGEPARSKLSSLCRGDLSRTLIVEMHKKPTAAANCWPEIGWGLAFLTPLPLLLGVAVYWDNRKARQAHAATNCAEGTKSQKALLAELPGAVTHLPANWVRLRFNPPDSQHRSE